MFATFLAKTSKLLFLYLTKFFDLIDYLTNYLIDLINYFVKKIQNAVVHFQNLLGFIIFNIDRYIYQSIKMTQSY